MEKILAKIPFPDAFQFIINNLKHTMSDFRASQERLYPQTKAEAIVATNCHLSPSCMAQRTADKNLEQLVTFLGLRALEEADRDNDAYFDDVELRNAWEIAKRNYAEMIRLCPPPSDHAKEPAFFRCIGSYSIRK